MRTDRLFLAGLGVHLPTTVATDAAGGWTGVTIAGEVPAPDLAVIAARRALAASGHSAVDIALVVHTSIYHQGPDGWSAAHYVQRHTVGGTAPALEIRGSCTGVLTAIELAYSWLCATNGSAALITSADNFGTPLIDRFEYASGAGTDRPSILGDSGTAIVLSRRGGFARVRAVGSAALPELEHMYRHEGAFYPPDCTVGRPVDIGNRINSFAQRDPAGFKTAKATLTDARTQLAQRTLTEGDITVADVRRVTHVFSGSISYVNSILEPLGLHPACGMLEFGRGVGHLGGGDHLAALDHLLATAQIGAGDHVLMLGNGTGVSLGCAVIEIL